jgi:hypothetical protein
LLCEQYPGIELDEQIRELEEPVDRYERYRLLLEPLAGVKQNAQYHPEGDALYHSLQVFELARQRRPWDEEFLAAALLHDVGKAIDSSDHVAAGLEALEGTITDRTRFLIAHHMDAHAYNEGTLGHRARIRLQQSDDFDDLLLLRELDRAGRRRGAAVCGVQEALAYLQAMEDEPYMGNCLFFRQSLANSATIWRFMDVARSTWPCRKLTFFRRMRKLAHLLITFS